MKKYIIIIFVIFLIILAGCKKANVNPVSTGTANTEAPANDTEKLPEVPDEWKGKKIKDIIDQQDIIKKESAEANLTPINQSQANSSAEDNSTKAAYNITEGTEIIELRKTETGMVFFPKVLKISTGDTVRWVNKLDYLDKKAKVTIYSYITGVFRSSQIGYGEYFDYTFNEKGNFSYNALPYQAYFGTGTIIVS